ncbi:MAG: acyltransferase family protein [Ilumatobacteraceae bacterium]
MTDVTFDPRRPLRGSSTLSKVPYLPGLDGLRAIAVIAVMVYHADPDWLSGGFLGVEVFFVISGYLITLLLMAEFERTGRVNLVEFWIRRARRLLPALFLMLFLLLTYSWIFRWDTLGKLRGDLIAGIFYGSNWYQIWVGQGYAAVNDFAPLRHLWSLAVEEQFYLVWPIVMALALRGRGTRRLARVAVVFVVIAVVVAVATAVLFRSGRVGECAATPEAYWTLGDRCIEKANALYLSTITRSSGLLLGAAFAIMWRPVAILRGPLRNASRVLDVLAVAGLAALALLHWRLQFVGPFGPDPWLFRGGFLLTGIATLVLIAAVTHRYTAMSTLLGNPLLRWVGTRSYGLYLFHWPIYQVIREVAGNVLTLSEFAVAMLATVVVTELSFRFVEMPIRTRQFADRWRAWTRSLDPMSRLVVRNAVVVVAVVALLGSLLVALAEGRPTAGARAAADNRDSITSLDAILRPASVADAAAPVTVDPREVTEPSTSAEIDPTPGATTPTVSVVTDPSSPAAATIPPVPTTPFDPASPIDPAGTPSTSTTIALPTGPVDYLAIGDSVMLGAANVLSGRGYVVNAEQNRQMIDMVPLFQQLGALDLFGDPVIIHLGTNGPISRETLDALLAPLADVPNVVLVNVRANRSWTERNNAILAERDAPGDNIILVDWATRSDECPGNCFAADGIHLTAEGARFYASLIGDVTGL